MIRIVSRPSPNHDERPSGVTPDMLVLHYTGMKTGEEAMARLCNADAKVSSHYTIDREGRINVHVAEDRRAWHAGVSFWAGETNINARSIGIELVNPGHEFGYVAFPKAQIESLIDLITGLRARYTIPQAHILGHSDVAPARKDDPGELFPWKELADNGIGLWPRAGAGNACAEDLLRFGYDPNAPREKVIAAFQRRFRPEKINGAWDAECGGLLASLLAGL